MTAEVDHISKQRNQLNASRSRYVSGLRGCRCGDSGRRGRGGYCGRGRDNPRQYRPTLSLCTSMGKQLKGVTTLQTSSRS